MAERRRETERRRDGEKVSVKGMNESDRRNEGGRETYIHTP